MGKSYFVCYRKDGHMENFNHNCIFITPVFDSNAVAFTDKHNRTLAIIPIHNIEIIEQYEEHEEEEE